MFASRRVHRRVDRKRDVPGVRTGPGGWATLNRSARMLTGLSNLRPSGVPPAARLAAGRAFTISIWALGLLRVALGISGLQIVSVVFYMAAGVAAVATFACALTAIPRGGGGRPCRALRAAAQEGAVMKAAKSTAALSLISDIRRHPGPACADA
jgi:hypothetical protein